MAVRHRIEGQRSVAPRHATTPTRRLLTVVLGVLAVVALLMSIGLFVAGMTIGAILAAAVCVAAGWGRSWFAAGGRSNA